MLRRVCTISTPTGAKFNGVGGSDPEVQWSLLPTPQLVEEELYISRRTVVWSSGGAIRKVFTVATEVVSAVWCNLAESDASDGSGRTLCVAERTCLTLFAGSGAIYSVPVPFPLAAVYPLAVGLLVDRLVAAGAGDGPTVFSLGHPLEEFRPVSQETVPMELKYENRSVLFADPITEVALLFDREARVHSICRLLKTRRPRVAGGQGTPTASPQARGSRPNTPGPAWPDPDELSLRPEYSFKQLWLGVGDVKPATKAFSLYDHAGLLLCILYREAEILECYRLDDADGTTHMKCTHAFTINAIDAAAVGGADMIILGLKGQVSLYTGQSRLAGLLLLLPDPYSGLARPHTELEMVIVGLNDQCPGWCSVCTKDGVRYRFSVELEPSSEAIRRCFSTLLALAGPKAEPRVPDGCKLVKFGGALEVYMFLRQAFVVAKDDGTADWQAFSDACQQLCGGAKLRTHETPSQNSDWDVFLSSDAHRETMCTMVYSSFPVVPVPSIRWQYGLNISDPGLGAAGLLCVLWLVHEDFGLNQMYAREHALLADLIGQIACCLGYDGYVGAHRRVAPGSDLETPSVPLPKECNFWSGAPAKPPVLRHWLRAQLCGRQSCSTFPTIPLSVPSWTEIVVTAYRQLRRGNSSYASVTGLLAETGFGSEELSTLPLGVALPLREAVRVFNGNSEKHNGNIDSEDDAESSTATTNDGTFISESITGLYFKTDLRVNEVRRILSSAHPTRVRIEQTPETSDHDFAAAQRAALLVSLQRAMALPVGRGMFTLNTHRPIITETVAIPDLNLTGRAPNKASVTLEEAQMTPAALAWPSFHNGVAAGLRVHKADCDTKLTTTWIAYHRPADNQLTDEHAGFLMALGLLGHLRELSTMTIYDYLAKGHETTSVGLLLGLAAANRGSMNPSVAKMLSIHVPALLPQTSAEIDVAQMVQVAAVVGIGLVYLGTEHRRITEVLLGEIGRRPGTAVDGDVNRESYSLGAGIALGMVMLGKGTESRGYSELRISERLRIFMEGGRDNINYKHDEPPICYKVKENAGVTVDVTCSGATIALGLMYLKTNDLIIANRLTVPDTEFLLTFCRPDFLMLRVLSQSLILWDSIEPSVKWVESKCPAVIANYRLGSKPSISVVMAADPDTELLRQCYANVVTGAIFSIGLKFAGTADPNAYAVMVHYAKMFTGGLDGDEDVGKSMIDTCTSVVMICMGMVMAGTGDLSAFRWMRRLHGRVSADVKYGGHMAVHMAVGLLFIGGGALTLDTGNEAIAAFIAAFFPMFPIDTLDNRYHLQALRHLYVLGVKPSVRIPESTDNKSRPTDEMLLHYFTEDREAKTFLKYFSGLKASDISFGIPRVRPGVKPSTFGLSVLSECLLERKFEAQSEYLSIESLLRWITARGAALHPALCQKLEDLAQVLEYHERAVSGKALFDSTYTALVRAQVDTVINSLGFAETLKRCLDAEDAAESNAAVQAFLGFYGSTVEVAADIRKNDDRSPFAILERHPNLPMESVVLLSQLWDEAV